MALFWRSSGVQIPRPLRIVGAGACLSALLLFGACSTGAGGGGNIETVREVRLGSEWKMNQLRLSLPSQGESAILLNLTAGGTVDGYFYLEKGSGVDFTVTGASVTYESKPRAGTTPAAPAADRFSFSADASGGGTYTLAFRNAGGSENSTNAVVFLEVIYPASGFAFVPLGAE